MKDKQLRESLDRMGVIYEGSAGSTGTLEYCMQETALLRVRLDDLASKLGYQHIYHPAERSRHTWEKLCTNHSEKS